eukprot:Gb_31583 [translate_table: standard]
MKNKEDKDIDEVIFREHMEELEERVKIVWREIGKTQESVMEAINLMHDVQVQIFRLKAIMGKASLSPHVIPVSMLHHGDASSLREVPLVKSPFEVESREKTKDLDEDLAICQKNEIYEKGVFEDQFVASCEKAQDEYSLSLSSTKIHPFSSFYTTCSQDGIRDKGGT